jgi:hypothetical protein
MEPNEPTRDALPVRVEDHDVLVRLGVHVLSFDDGVDRLDEVDPILLSRIAQQLFELAQERLARLLRVRQHDRDAEATRRLHLGERILEPRRRFIGRGRLRRRLPLRRGSNESVQSVHQRPTGDREERGEDASALVKHRELLGRSPERHPTQDNGAELKASDSPRLEGGRDAPA